jgi:putative ABC transport system ATP-binding protein
LAPALNRAHTSASVAHLEDVYFAWPGRNSFALKVRRFALEAGERVLLVGPSGSGKSTFLSLLCGTLAPKDGRIEILGTDLVALSGPVRDAFRAEHFGIIFQMFNLLPYGTVVDNIVLPLAFARARRDRATRGSTAEATARGLLERLGLEQELGWRPAATLSIGQQQRVAAARALIGAPEIIVADEPTSALDRDRQAVFLDVLFTQIKEAGATLIMVSHDQGLASRFDRVVRLEEIAQTVPA